MRCVKLHASLAHVCSVGRCVSLGCCFVGFVLLLPSHGVRHEVCADVRLITFTVAILAQGTNRGDALCAALLLRRVGSNPTRALFLFVAAQVVRKSTKVGAGKPTLWATGAAPRCSYAPLRRRAAASGSGGDFLRPAVFARTVTVETS